jgi:transcriptional regulator with XRE-family HTH domain
MADALIVKSYVEQRLEHQHGVTVETLLRRLYVTEGMSQEQVAQTLGVSRMSVYLWMRKYGIPTRDRRAIAA